MTIQKYSSLLYKMLYANNGKPYGNGYREVQVCLYPFHTGVRVLVTDGYKYIKDIHCKNACEAVKEFKAQYKQIA